MAACLRCGGALAEAWLDVYCAPCLDVVYDALATLLIWSASPTWRISAHWWAAYAEVKRAMQGGLSDAT